MSRKYLVPLVVIAILVGSMYTLNLFSIPRQDETSLNSSALIDDKLPEELTSAPSVTDEVEKLGVSDKIDNLLKNWMNYFDDGKYINRINGKVAVNLVAVGDDPSLDGAVNPLGYFKLGDSGAMWIHATIDNPEKARQALNNRNVLKIEADRNFAEKRKDVNLREGGDVSSIAIDEADLPPISTRDLTGQTAIEEKYGFTGKNVYVQVVDAGVDFGATALIGTLALDSNNHSMSFDISGFGLAISSLFSEKYYTDNGQPQLASNYAPLHRDASGYLDTSNMDDLLIYDPIIIRRGTFPNFVPASDFGLSWLPEITIPDRVKIGNFGNNNTGYAFGLTFALVNLEVVMAPFIIADTTGDGNHDSMLIDYEGARQYSRALLGQIDMREVIQTSDFDFTNSPVHKNDNNHYLAADILDGHDWGQDGYNDISLSALSNSYDLFNITGRLGNSDPFIRGIDPSGEIFAFSPSIDEHGTWVSGDIAAQSLNYTFSRNNAQFDVKGIATDAKIASNLFLSDSAVIYGALWAAGYEAQVDLEWKFTGARIMNISSNSWGYPGLVPGNIEDDNFAYGFDLTSLMHELITHPGLLSEDHPGLLFVVSSGNAGPGYGTSGSPYSPSSIMVGASTSFTVLEYEGDAPSVFDNLEFPLAQGLDQVSSFSSPGPGTTNYPTVDVVNVGLYDYSVDPAVLTIPGNESWVRWAGTSLSQPLTTGAIAIIMEAWSVNNSETITPDLVKVVLKSTTVDLGFDTYRQGAGRVDIERAVEAIITKQLPTGEDLFLAYTTDSYDTIGQRLDAAFTYWFGDNEILNITNYNVTLFPSNTLSIKDSSLYGGIVNAGTSTTLNFRVNNSGAISSVTPKTFSTIYNVTNPTVYTQDELYEYYSLDSLFGATNYQTADFVQVIVSSDVDAYEDRAEEDESPRFLLFVHDDTNSDGKVEQREMRTYDYIVADYHAVSMFASSNVTLQNAYIAVLDPRYKLAPEDVTTDLEYTFSIRAFQRVVDSNVGITPLGGGDYEIDFSPVANAIPGFYQGLVIIDGNNGGYSLMPYTYSVPLEAKDYSTDGWASIDQLRNQPYDNLVFSAVDLGWRYQTGDWRMYDLELGGASFNTDANTLGIEIEWTYDETVIDVFVVDAAGFVAATSDIEYVSAGRFNSESNAEPTMQRLLVNLTNYRLGDTFNGGDFSNGYNQFTLVLHAVKIDPRADLFDPIKIRAAWVSETISDFTIPTPSLIRTGSLTYNQLEVTEDIIGVEWTQVTTNPIPSFNTINQEITAFISQEFSNDENGTILASEMVPDSESEGAIVAEKTYEIFLTEGTTITAEIFWDDFLSDVDLFLVPADKPVAAEYDLFGTNAATLEIPEIGSASIPKDGFYIIAIDFYDGPIIDLTFELQFYGQEVIERLSTTTQNSLQLSLLDNNRQDARYTLESRTNGWNFKNNFTTDFILDTQGPQIDTTFAEIQENVIGDVVIGTVFDPTEFDYTLTLNGNTVTSGQDLEGYHQLVIDSSFVTGIYENVTFDFSGTDVLGKTSNSQITVRRSDDTDPVIGTTPPVEIDLTVGESYTLVYRVSDSTSGTYSTEANTIEIATGVWQSDVDVEIMVSFDTIGVQVLSTTFTDLAGNAESHLLRIHVEADTMSDPTQPGDTTTETRRKGLSFPLYSSIVGLLFMFVMIPIVVSKTRKSSKN